MSNSRSTSPARGPLDSGEDRGGAGDGGGGGGGGGGGRLVKVAFAHSLMEAEMIQGLLSEHGIPSLVKRGPGFDVPEFMPVGPRQIFVAEASAPRAREVLEGTPGGDAAAGETS
jgi:Putative prokaryotic signal transducing protein